MKRLFVPIKRHGSLLFVIGVALLSIWPLFHAGLIPTHDGEYHLIRFFEFDKMLRSGYWYPRWAPDLNYGYGVPLFTFVYPLPNYVASLFHLFGVTFLDSVKLNMVVATIVGAVLMFLWIEKLWGKSAGLISAIFYTFGPYHFVDMYVRGSVGEVWALGIFPGFLYSFTAFTQTKKLHYAILSVIFLSLTIFSHNIVGLMSFVFAITYILLYIFLEKKKKELLLASGLVLFLSLTLSAIFWLPALLEKNLTTGLEVYSVTKNFTDLFLLLFPSWGTGFYGTSLDNQMSVQIGTANLLVTAGSIVLFWKLWRGKEKQFFTILAFFLGWFFLLFFLMLPASKFLWDIIPLMNYFQFPWRFLSLIILVCSALAGALVAHWGSKRFLVFLIFLAIATTYSYTQPAYYMQRSDSYYTTRPNFIDGTNSVGNVFNTKWGRLQTQQAPSLFIKQKSVYMQNSIELSPTHFSAILSAKKLTNETLAISYFPGWTIIVDNKKTMVAQKSGLIAFSLPEGKHVVSVYLAETAVEQLATYITIVTFLFLILLFLLRKRIETVSIQLWGN